MKLIQKSNLMVYSLYYQINQFINKISIFESTQNKLKIENINNSINNYLYINPLTNKF